MEDKIKQIISDLISQIDGDWQLFMCDEEHKEYVDVCLKKILDVLKDE